MDIMDCICIYKFYLYVLYIYMYYVYIYIHIQICDICMYVCMNIRDLCPKNEIVGISCSPLTIINGMLSIGSLQLDQPGR